MHEVGLLPISAQIVSTQSLPKTAVVPCRLAYSAPHKSGGRRVQSWPDDTHTNKHIPVIWICDLCHKQINKKQTSIRCNHTHNTHWVHLKFTHNQHTQHRTTAGQNTHRQDQIHHSSKHVLSIKRHDVTTLQHRGHRHRILHTTHHQYIRLNNHR